MSLQKHIATQLVVLAFALAMVGCGGGATSSTHPPTVQPPSTPPAAPTASLSANPSTIDKGESTTLTWETTNATDVSIDGLGAVQPSGSQTVTPADSTTYTLTAKGAGGMQTAMATVAVIAPPPPPPPPTGGYTITILPLLSGTAEASATAINDAGVIVGYSLIENPTTGSASFEATMWQDGVPSDLGTGVATAINSNNQVAGYTTDNQAWFWSAATGRIMIGILPGFGFDSSLAQGIDDDGTVVGISFLDGSASEEGFKWRMDTGIQPVQNLIEIFAIKKGLMAGRGTNGLAATATNTEFLSQSVVTNLGVLGGNFSGAFGVNGLGHACGNATTNTGVTHAFFWTQSQGIVDLGTGGTGYGYGFGLNDLDQVVGIIGNSPSGMVTSRVRLRSRIIALPRTIDATDRAMSWTEATGIVNLNTLVTSPDWTLSTANGINNKGEIVGSAYNHAILNQAFILEPK